MTRATALLGLGALAGVALAASGLISSAGASKARLADDAVARVNGQPVRKLDYERMLTALAGDKRGPLTDEDKRHILDRLVEEELLVQRGIELGLVYDDTRVRRELTASLLESIVAPTRDLQPSEDELRAFYAEQKDLFGATDELQVRQVWVQVKALADADSALTKAKAAAARLRQGEDIEAVRSELGDREIAPLPDSLMPANKLADYLGPTPLRVILDLPVGQVSDPVRSSSGYHVLQVLQRAPAPPPPFEQAQEQILEAYRRDAANKALRAYLDDLRTRAQVEISDAAPK